MPEKSNGSDAAGAGCGGIGCALAGSLVVSGRAERVGSCAVSGESRRAIAATAAIDESNREDRRIRWSGVKDGPHVGSAEAPLHYRTLVTDSQHDGNAPVPLPRS